MLRPGRAHPLLSKHVNTEEFGSLKGTDCEGHGRINMERFQENNVDSLQALEWLELSD